MLSEYLRAAMAKAHYELLGGGEGFYGEIPGFQGAYARGETLEACREELVSTLEDWLLFRVSRHLPIPVVDVQSLARPGTRPLGGNQPGPNLALIGPICKVLS